MQESSNSSVKLSKLHLTSLHFILFSYFVSLSCGNPQSNKVSPAVSFVVNFNLKWVQSILPYRLMQHKNTWETFVSLLKLSCPLSALPSVCINSVILNLSVAIQTWSEGPFLPFSSAPHSFKHFCNVTFSQFQWQKIPLATERICFYFWKM